MMSSNALNQIGVSVAEKSTVKIILTTDRILSDPVLCKGYQQYQILNLFLDTLVRKNPSMGIDSGVAQSWTVSEDQTEYTFQLKPNLLFHNQDIVTSKDIKFSFERHFSDYSHSFLKSYLKNVLQEIKVIDQFSIKFKLYGAYPPFLELLAMPGLGIISHKSVQDHIIGSGPYEFEEKEGKKTNCLKIIDKYSLKKGMIEKFCFVFERDIDKTIEMLNSNVAHVALGPPLEVACSQKLNNSFVRSPFLGLVSTNVFLNHSNILLRSKANRLAIKRILYKTRDQKILTQFDRPLNTLFPHGIMPESYYASASDPNNSCKLPEDTKLKIIFPYGIFLKESIRKIAEAFENEKIKVEYSSLKGKDYLDSIVKGDYDLIFIPYQGVISDPDGFLDLLSPLPGSIMASAGLPTLDLNKKISSLRFTKNRSERLRSYQQVFKDFESESHIIPFSQNGIPIIYRNNLSLRSLSSLSNVSLREFEFK